MTIQNITSLSIVLASTNHGKVAEFKAIAPELNLVPIGEGFDCLEDGLTFAENSRKKALQGALQTNSWCLADDSGLCVDALGGRPGIYSARAFAQNGMSGILTELASEPNRRGRYVCSLALADPASNIVWQVEEYWEGCIALEPSGERGFGYDPIFVPNGHSLSVAELPEDIKRTLSHRARATQALRSYLHGLQA